MLRFLVMIHTFWPWARMRIYVPPPTPTCTLQWRRRRYVSYIRTQYYLHVKQVVTELHTKHIEHYNLNFCISNTEIVTDCNEFKIYIVCCIQCQIRPLLDRHDAARLKDQSSHTSFNGKAWLIKTIIFNVYSFTVYSWIWTL